MNKEFNEEYKDEIIKILRDYDRATYEDHACFNSNTDKISGKTVAAISKLQCPKCKNIRYMDRKHLKEIFEEYQSAFDDCVGWDDIPKIIKEILLLAIPDNRKIKELENQVKITNTVFLGLSKEFGDANRKIGELQDEIERLKDRIGFMTGEKVIKMPPISSKKVKLKITDIKKGKPSICDEVETD